MRLSRGLLFFNAAVFFGIAIWCLVDPHGALSPIGVVPSRPHGAAELRAMYGGLEIGVAAFLLACARRPAWHGAGLLLCTLALLGLGLTRTIAALATGTFNELHPLLAGTELAGAALNLWGYRRAKP
jgi:hypothetical protein